MHSLDKYEEETAPNEKTIPAQKEARRDVKTSKGNNSNMVDVSDEDSKVKSMPDWHERNPFHDAIHSTERLAYIILFIIFQDVTGVPAPTIARFENSARISLESFVRLSMALGYEEELKNLFREDKYASMEEMLAMKENKNRTRGRRKCSSCLNH